MDELTYIQRQSNCDPCYVFVRYVEKSDRNEYYDHVGRDEWVLSHRVGYVCLKSGL